jgi:hypothetical protein
VFWLDEDHRPARKIAPPRQGAGGLGIPLHRGGVEHHANEGVAGMKAITPEACPHMAGDHRGLIMSMKQVLEFWTSEELFVGNAMRACYVGFSTAC